MKIRIYKEYNENILTTQLSELKEFLEKLFSAKIKSDYKYESSRGYIDFDFNNTYGGKLK
jgi:hypothetical protein